MLRSTMLADQRRRHQRLVPFLAESRAPTCAHTAFFVVCVITTGLVGYSLPAHDARAVRSDEPALVMRSMTNAYLTVTLARLGNGGGNHT